VLNWISESRTAIQRDTTVKSFLRCGISNAMDGSQDDELLDHFSLSETELRPGTADLLFNDSDLDD
jgi:hypothetical protein